MAIVRAVYPLENLYVGQLALGYGIVILVSITVQKILGLDSWWPLHSQPNYMLLL